MSSALSHRFLFSAPRLQELAAQLTRHVTRLPFTPPLRRRRRLSVRLRVKREKTCTRHYWKDSVTSSVISFISGFYCLLGRGDIDATSRALSLSTSGAGTAALRGMNPRVSSLFNCIQDTRSRSENTSNGTNIISVA